MNRRVPWLRLLLLGLLVLPFTCPAPLVYSPGEGWVYEPVGGGKWTRARAKDQFEVAQAAYDDKDYSLAIKAARRTAKVWPLSDYAARAQYLVGLSYQAKKDDEKAFKEYTKLLQRYPKFEKYEDVLQRQYEIANKYLAGKWFKLWGVIPFFSNMDRTVKMYEEIIQAGPYSQVAPQAQLSIGDAREKQVSFFNRTDPFREAVRAYIKAADRYSDNAKIAATGVYKAGVAYFNQAQKAEYDQSIAGKAIATFTDFAALYPSDPRVADSQKKIATLKLDQARGSFDIAEWYEARNRYRAALIYYNEAIVKGPSSTYAEEAKKRVEQIKQRVEAAGPVKVSGFSFPGAVPAAASTNTPPAATGTPTNSPAVPAPSK